MASSININVGNTTSTKQLGKTDQEVGQILRWFVKDKIGPVPAGLTQTQINQFYLDFVRDELVRYIQSEAKKNRLRELKEEQQSIENQAESETSL